MKPNSTVFQTLSTLSPLERKHLLQWLQSPGFTRREAPCSLCRYLFECMNSGAAPDKSEAWRRIGDSVALSKKKAASAEAIDQALRNVMSELLRLTEQFLVIRERETPPEAHLRDLVAVYRKRGLDKHFQRAYREASDAWERRTWRDTDYFDARASLEFEQYQYLSAHRQTDLLNLQAVSDATDAAYLVKKLRQVCLALTHQSVYQQVNYDFGLLQPILRYLSESPAHLNNNTVGLYYHCYFTLIEPEEESHFQQFKIRLFDSSVSLPTDELRNLHLFAINYCIKKINQLKTPYLSEALDLYRSALVGGLLLENGVLSHWAFNNIVTIALRVGEVRWAERFIVDYADFLEKKHRQATYFLNLARIACADKQYETALGHLQKAEGRDLANNLIGKTLQLKIYYETDDYDALDAQMQNMTAYIRRQRSMGYHKTNYLNIIRYMRKLAAHNPNDRAEKEALRRQIIEEQTLTEKDWFLEMLA